MSTRRADGSIVALFLLALSLPAAANLAGFDGADPAAENREMAPFPRLHRTWRSLATLPDEFGRWFEDHFGLRAALVRWDGELHLFGLGVSPSPSVLVGANGWLFYADDSGVEDYTNEKPMSPAERDDWRATIGRVHDWLHAQGIGYVFTIAPDKHVIYPEQMPPTLARVHDVSRADQVYQALAGTGVTAVDLRPALGAAKRRERVYALTDTHWNDRGAFAAYRALIAAARAELPSIPPAWTDEDFVRTEQVVHGLDLAGMMGLTRTLREPDLTLTPRRPRRARVVDPPGATPDAEVARVVTEIPGSSLPRAVVFRDSFASRLAPFLSEHFSRVVYVWQNDFDPDLIARERPDLVVEEIVGRHLYSFWPTPDLIPRD